MSVLTRRDQFLPAGHRSDQYSHQPSVSVTSNTKHPLTLSEKPCVYHGQTIMHCRNPAYCLYSVHTCKLCNRPLHVYSFIMYTVCTYIQACVNVADYWWFYTHTHAYVYTVYTHTHIHTHISFFPIPVYSSPSSVQPLLCLFFQRLCVYSCVGTMGANMKKPESNSLSVSTYLAGSDSIHSSTETLQN